VQAINQLFICTRLKKALKRVREPLFKQLKPVIRNLRKIRNNIFRLSFMSAISDYFECDLCLSKIKIEDKNKTIAFDEKNNRLAVVSFERVMYYIDIPAVAVRHISEAEVRTF
jgi:hypothetical protein